MKRIQKLLVFLLCFVMMLPTVGCSNLGHEHKVVKKVGVAPTCLSGGTLEHFQCVVCDKLFADKACTKELKPYEINLGKSSHDIKYNPAVASTPDKVGTKEYYSCTVCEKYFSDSLGKSEISEEDLVLGKYNYVDFTITVDSGKEPVILQFADPQIMDSSTKRSDTSLDANAIKYWNKDSRQELAYDLMAEVVEASNPDLILVSGDNIYGRYDDDGHLHEEFVEFMESFNIPWAPILGNHDIETAKGVDWICDLYEGAPNCLFKKHTTSSNDTISGHGNYTIGIAQDGEMKRVIFNMDTNGCTNASDKSKACPQTIYQTNNSYNTSYGVYGLQKDQVAWFEDTAEKITGEYAGVKLSLHIHVPMNKVYTAMNDAYKAKVGDPVARMYYAFNNITPAGKFLAPERVIGHTEGDFGILYTLYPASFTECWDTDKTNGEGTQDQIYDRIKAQGIDSMFLGHMHSNSVSIVYDGIRFQFGQKCTLYDSVQYINNSTGAVDAVAAWAINKQTSTPLIGGTVMKLNAAGEIADAYIEYNTGYGKEINWSQYYNTIG